ncbi:FUSC family protein [Priestia taiwanensis]|uniref:Lipoprotein n=1 Tax=Priestia taiwanensis TaxID=1347902 RepID=A0A917AW37_9BACI|nr:aromatic acid exporter family protein [Priestia taiwanensis]MBM7364622.1 uncharacterized membrane protein YgaE (UPF0421/DUF939 family) [Priestia taiwanensis]GGE78258.1 lipoprotein [Priestia taiwanensis]
MKLGARIIKTGIAITLAIYIASLFNLPSPVFAGISAVFALQPSVYRSYQTILEQFQANVLGAVFAVIFTLTFGNSPVIIGLTCVVVIALALRFHMGADVAIALVTIISIMEYAGEDFLQFALLRFATIMVGLICASILNIIFLPPKYETKLYHNIAENTEEIIKWIRLSIRQASDHTALKEEITKLKEDHIKLRYFYLLYKEERSYFRRSNTAKARKLVLFRQMISTTNRSFETLKYLNRLENQLHHVPEDLQEMIKNELDCLVTYHEQILLKCIGKVKNQTPSNVLEEVKKNKLLLMSKFMECREENDEESYSRWIQLMKLISSITDYSDKLEHLDLLVESFLKYHKDENELHIEDKKEH